MTSGLPESILLVEDNPLIAEWTSRVLSSHGHDVRLADSGELALDMVQGLEPDCILLDMHLNGQNGDWFVNELSKVRCNMKSVPVLVVLSLYRPEELTRKYPSLAVDGVLSKPFSYEVFRSVVQKSVGADARCSGAASASAFNPALLSELYGDSPAFLSEVLQDFKRMSAGHVEQIEQSIVQSDWKSLVEHSHRLAGLCLNFGLTELVERTRRMELDPQESELSDLELLKKDYGVAIAELESFASSLLLQSAQ